MFRALFQSCFVLGLRKWQPRAARIQRGTACETPAANNVIIQAFEPDKVDISEIIRI
jgi:hypothetical protein